MSYIVDRIPEQVMDRSRCRGRSAYPGGRGRGQSRFAADSVTISDEATRRSGAEAGGPGEGAA